MNKLFLFISTLFLSVAAYAEGYQINLLSTKQIGMGHVGTGMKLGATSIHFNPAGLVFMNNKFDLSTGTSLLFSKAKYSFEEYKAETNNPVGTPLYLYAGYKINDNWAVGLSFSTPYGSSIKWPHAWLGAELVQEITLRAYVFQPTVSYKITDKLSIGTGLNIAFGDVDLERALIGASEFQTVGDLVQASPSVPDEIKAVILNVIRNNNIPPAYAHLNGSSRLNFGFNVGIMYEPCEKVTLGLSYRSKIKMRVKSGHAELEYGNETLEYAFKELITHMPNLVIPRYDKGTFNAALPLPSNTTLGASYRPTEQWEIAADIQFVGWHAYDSLNLYFNEADLGLHSIKTKKDYKNTFIYRLGASYKASDIVKLRAGIYYDKTPVRQVHYNPETPGMNKLGLSLGSSFTVYKNLDIDLAFLYIQGFSRDGSYTYTNIVTQQQDVFQGHYKSYALTPSIGVSYSF